MNPTEDLSFLSLILNASLIVQLVMLILITMSIASWTVIFNSDWNLEHGHFQHNEKNDVLRVEVQPQWEAASQESLSIAVEAPGIVIRWEKLKLPIAVQ